MTKSAPKNKPTLRSNGFSLIEILIGVAIIGIMASVAVPMYGSYVLRTKVTEAVQLNQRARHAMIDYHQKHGKFVTNYSDWSKRNKAIGLADMESYESEVIKRMWVGSTGIIGKDNESAHIATTLQEGFDLSSDSKPPRIITTILFENGGYKFVCGSTSADAKWATNVKPEYMPSTCQN